MFIGTPLAKYSEIYNAKGFFENNFLEYIRKLNIVNNTYLTK